MSKFDRIPFLITPIEEAISSCEDFEGADHECGSDDTNFLAALDDALGGLQLKACARIEALREMEQQILAERNGARWMANKREADFEGEQRGA